MTRATSLDAEAIAVAIGEAMRKVGCSAVGGVRQPGARDTGLVPTGGLRRSYRPAVPTTVRLAGTGASAARLYQRASASSCPGQLPPVGCSIFPKEIFRPSRRWAEQRFLRPQRTSAHNLPP